MFAQKDVKASRKQTETFLSETRRFLGLGQEA